MSLPEAVAEAIRSGTDELDRLASLIKEAEHRLGGSAWLVRDGRPKSVEADGYSFLLDAAVSDLVDKLDRNRAVLSTFNVVFFGRTGVGKSTLLSALGRLDGELISDGHSDFTTEVRSLDWNGCRLYDTPGINGWGRTQSRQDLEEKARVAVETADVVLLCFDTQSQQAAEFAKVAEWVHIYRKPALAILNVRNPMWRDPLRAPSPEHRLKLAAAVREHAVNISDELQAIGLSGVPVVAIHSKRCLFARASTPFRGPAANELENMRAARGVDYLEKWSNLPVLEGLLTAYVTEGATDLRVAAVREMIRAGFNTWANQIDAFVSGHRDRCASVERTVADWLNVLGYPGDRSNLPAKGGVSDLISTLEELIGKPFGASSAGRLERHAQQILRSLLSPHRARSIAAAEDLIREAFDDRRTVSDVKFNQQVFDQAQVDASAAEAARSAMAFLEDNLKLSGRDAALDLDLVAQRQGYVKGAAGAVNRITGNVLKASQLVAGGAAAVLGIIAATNFWNPAGWMAAVILGGLGIAGSVMSFFGGLARKKAERVRTKARAQALADARAAVNSYFDECESKQLQRIMQEAWALASAPFAGLLKEAIHDRRGTVRVGAAAAWLRDIAVAQPAPPSPELVADRVVARLHQRLHSPALPTVSAMLLGEDWVAESSAGRAYRLLSDRDNAEFDEAARRARGRFSSHLAGVIAAADGDDAAAWLRGIGDADFLEPLEKDEIERARASLDLPPRLAVLGDFSSGKTSLIKRLLAETGSPTPDFLRVHAAQATDAVQRHPFGSFTLVDTPGFQSRADSYDTAAFAAAESAALVLVVLHVNLLIGDLTHLDRLLLGTEVSEGKLDRTIFVIGRIDELGADPHSSAGELTSRRLLKEAELAQALAARGIQVRTGQVLTVAADPFGLVGDRLPVSRSDYSDVNRGWDGIDTLSAPLHALDREQLRVLASHAAADLAMGTLLRLQNRLQGEIADMQVEYDATVRLQLVIGTALQELDLVSDSAKRLIERIVNDHANEMIAEALGADPREVEAMARSLAAWSQDPRLRAGLEAGMKTIERDLEEWRQQHEPHVGRELSRWKSTMSAEGLETDPPLIGTENGAGLRFAAALIREAARMVKAAGTRDAVYTIGKKVLGMNFKPWGAVKAGARVARVGAVLGVVAVGFDVAAWVKAQRDENSRESARKLAADHIRETAPKVIDQIIGTHPAGTGEVPENLVASADHLREQLASRVEELQRESAQQYAAITAANSRVEAITRLIKLRKEAA